MTDRIILDTTPAMRRKLAPLFALVDKTYYEGHPGAILAQIDENQMAVRFFTAEEAARIEATISAIYQQEPGQGDPAGPGWASVQSGAVPLPDCGDPLTGQPCRNETAEHCGECPGLATEAAPS